MRPDQINEQELQFKKRARRRLVGAIALVILIVTVLPMLLHDRTNKPQLQEIAITIPSQDAEDFNSKITPVAQGVASVPVQADRLDSPIEQTHTTSDLSIKDKPDSAEKTSGPRPLALTVDKPMIDNQTIQTKDLEKKPVKIEANKQGMFLVQIGVFSDPANVKQLQLKLQEQGYKSHTEKLVTAKGEKIRLRLGSFASRTDAENALAEISKIGLSGMVITK
ncbi:MAG: sporulation protein [Methylophilaceae bacterium]|nr:sporulation protein [Methylophilaceae bacterium]